ncbi:MAG: hypothetical protein KBF76_10740 [Verrucomicrobiales bacterium]|nr:hypothetical protein [Verrucomicrobiales bacterium]
MRFILSEHSWILDALSPAEWHLLSELPAIAAGIEFQDSTRDRLFPSPLAPDVVADANTIEQIEDWDELIRPELEETFASARHIVEEDLKRFRQMPAADLATEIHFHGEVEEYDDEFREEMEFIPSDETDFYRVEVPLEHTEAWYSTLNQARILMNEEFNIANSEERFIARSGGIEGLDEVLMVLIAQYELYSVVQSILVENIMSD